LQQLPVEKKSVKEMKKGCGRLGNKRYTPISRPRGPGPGTKFPRNDDHVGIKNRRKPGKCSSTNDD